MSRAVLIIGNDGIRKRARHWIDNVPLGTRITFQAPKRTLPQNDKMHAMLTELAPQVLWHGMRLSVDDWKLFFLDALGQEIRMVPNMNGTGFVNLGRHTSALSTPEMSDMIELIYAFGAQHGVKFNDPLDMKEAA